MNRELNMMKLHQINPRIIEEMNIPQRLAESVGYIKCDLIILSLNLSSREGIREFL